MILLNEGGRLNNSQVIGAVVRTFMLGVMFMLFAVSTVTVVARPQAPDTSEAIESAKSKQIQRIAELLNGCIVQIEFVGGNKTQRTSGTVIDNQGHVLTHATGLSQAPDTILVTTADGKQQLGTWVAVDHVRNLLLLKTDPIEVENFCIPVDNAEVKVGQTVLALGKMLDPAQVSVSEGIVSAKGRIWGKATQADAKIGPLNYGGPLVDLQGRMVGLLTPLSMDVQANQQSLQWYDSGIGFAVDLSDYAEEIEKLKSGNDIRQGISGIEFQQANLNSRQFPISSVAPMSPAAEAGLQKGDQIIAIHGHEVSCLADFYQHYYRLAAEETVDLMVQAETPRKVTLQLVDRLPVLQSGALGVVVAEKEGLLQVLITLSSDVPLQVDDVLVSAQGVPLQRKLDLETVLDNLPVDTELQLEIQREGVLTKVNVPLKSLGDYRLSSEQLGQLVGRLATGQRKQQVVAVPELVGSGLLSQFLGDEDERLSRPLLVLLRDSLQSNAQLLKQWEETADQFQLDLLVIGPQDKQWSADDLNCIDKIVAKAGRQISNFEQRDIAIVSLGDARMTAVALLASDTVESNGFVFRTDQLDDSFVDQISSSQGGIVHPKRLLLLSNVEPEWWKQLEGPQLLTDWISDSSFDGEVSEHGDSSNQSLQEFGEWIWSLKIR